MCTIVFINEDYYANNGMRGLRRCSNSYATWIGWDDGVRDAIMVLEADCVIFIKNVNRKEQLGLKPQEIEFCLPIPFLDCWMTLNKCLMSCLPATSWGKN